jgi:DNA repair ATPase RecN
LLSVGLNIYQYSAKNTIVTENKNERDSLITARVDIEKELNETYSELNQYKGENARMDSLLSKANTDLQSYENKIASLLKSESNKDQLNKKLIEELKEIKKLRDQYLEKIDNLLSENSRLKKDNSDLNTKVEQISKDLQNTVNTASVLRVEYLNISSLKKKYNDKYAPTLLAKRTNKFDVCFTVLENKIAKSGTRTIYLRLISPNGRVIGDRAQGSGNFTDIKSNSQMQFTLSKSLDYSNANANECMTWESAGEKYDVGIYTAEIYIDGQFSSSKTLELR